jgi:hypothetical protein
MPILTIPITTSPQLPPSQLDDAATVARRLLDKGYDEVDLVGLTPFKAYQRDGRIHDLMPLRVDDDVEFLVEGYHALPAATTKHWVYLADGCFEIFAHIRGNDVKLRVGEYRTSFDFDSEDGVMISLQEYRAFWDSIASALALASAP